MKLKKLVVTALSCTVAVSVIVGTNPLIPSSLKAEAAIQKYERKSITILGEADNVLNRLFTRLFRDMGRFDYYNIPVGRDAQLEAVGFLKQVKDWYDANKKDIAQGKTVPDTKFKDKIITKEEAEKIVKAAYVMVPEFEVGQPENISLIDEEDTGNEVFGVRKFSFGLPATLQTKIFNVTTLDQYAVLESKQSLYITIKRHYRKSKGSTDAENYLNSQKALLSSKTGVWALLNTLSSDAQDHLVRLESPDEVGKMTEELQNKLQKEIANLDVLAQGQIVMGLANAIAEGFDPTDPKFTRLATFFWKDVKDLNSDEINILEAAYNKKETQGVGSAPGTIVHAINSNMAFSIGLMPDTIKQAKNLDAFLVKAPAKDAKPAEDYVSMGFGKETGVDLDNWYRIQEIILDDATGNKTITDKAWVKIRNVLDNKSEAQTIILNKDYEDDDQMVEYPMMGTNWNFKPTVDMFNASDMAVGGTVDFEYDISGYINRASNRKVSIPELYGLIELGASVPMGKILNRTTWGVGKVKVGLMQRMYMRQD